MIEERIKKIFDRLNDNNLNKNNKASLYEFCLALKYIDYKNNIYSIISVATYLSSYPNIFDKQDKHTMIIRNFFLEASKKIKLSNYGLVDFVTKDLHSEMIKEVMEEIYNKNIKLENELEILFNNFEYLISDIFENDNINFNIIFNNNDNIDHFIELIRNIYTKKQFIKVFYKIYKYHIFEKSFGPDFSNMIPNYFIFKLIVHYVNTINRIKKITNKICNKHKKQ